jgi:uncharacterized SAM-binding protein YcdF (DUF218 family)
MRRALVRIPLALLTLWVLGLAWFAVALPGPSDDVKTDGIVVLTGGAGRLARGVQVLNQGHSRMMLVSGVDRSVRPGEFQLANSVAPALLRCCIELGKQATDTVSNAREAAEWVRRHKHRSIRLVTSDWHIRRARLELEQVLDSGVSIVADGVPTTPSLDTILLEYNKFLLREVSIFLGYG